MVNQVEKVLSKPQMELLQQENPMILATVDHETGGPMVNAISWIYAPKPDCLQFAVHERSKIVRNIKENKEVTFTWMGLDTMYSITGTVVGEPLLIEGTGLPLARFRVVIREVRDIMYYGSRLVTKPTIEKTYDVHAASKLDSAVLHSLKTL